MGRTDVLTFTASIVTCSVSPKLLAFPGRQKYSRWSLGPCPKLNPGEGGETHETQSNQ